MHHVELREHLIAGRDRRDALAQDDELRLKLIEPQPDLHNILEHLDVFAPDLPAPP